MKKRKSKSSSKVVDAIKNLRLAIRKDKKKKKRKSEYSSSSSYSPISRERETTATVSSSVVTPVIQRPTYPVYSDAELAAYRKQQEEEDRRRRERYKQQDEYLAEQIEHHRWMARTGGDPYGG